jgi:hypothetical protein
MPMNAYTMPRCQPGNASDGPVTGKNSITAMISGGKYLTFRQREGLFRPRLKKVFDFIAYSKSVKGF